MLIMQVSFFSSAHINRFHCIATTSLNYMYIGMVISYHLAENVFVANRDLTPSEIAELFNQLDLDES